MPNENYVLLERTELNASVASVTFANIPQSGYTDLKVVCSLRSSRTPSTDGAHIALTFNNNTSSVYSFVHIRGTGSAASSYSESGATSMNLYSQADSSADTANTFSNNEIYIPNYTGSTNKSVSVDSVYENNATTAGQHLLAGLFASTAAITSIKLAEGFGNNWVAGSTFSLYGIAAVGTTPAIAPKASGGNVIATDGTYWYHTFTSSGTFTPATTLSCDILQVAAGGGGGRGGGGGAGGLLGFTSQPLSIQNYSITIGAGGTTNNNVDTRGTNGNNSVFGSLTASVGGGGGGGFSNTSIGYGASGGSGGGGGGSDSTLNVGGSATSGQGNAGGNGSVISTVNAGGGGGGAGAVGANASVSNAGAGGIGSSAYSSWGSATNTGQNVSGTYYYAGGGGGIGSSSGGSGGSGGGATGGTYASSAGVSGTINTGGGASGATSGTANGGSGIVIIRYPAA